MKLDSGPRHWFKSQNAGNDATSENMDITSENVEPDRKDKSGVVDFRADSAVNLHETYGGCEDGETLDEDDGESTSNESDSEYTSD